MRRLPAHLRPPLRPDEKLAQEYADRPGRLIELAEMTGNRALRALGLQMRNAQRDRAAGR